VIEVVNSYTEEFADDHVRQDQESNIGLVIDGEVCRHLSADTRLFHVVHIAIYRCRYCVTFLTSYKD